MDIQAQNGVGDVWPLATSVSGSKERAGRPIMAAEVGLERSHAGLLERARTMHADDPQAVAEARQAIQAGLLDTPEQWLSAAEKILDYGI